MVPLRGWAPKGARLRGFAPHGHWRTMTFLGALRCDRLTAPCVFDGPINGECFRAYVKQLLVPCLGPGDIVIMDNLGSHKSAELRRIIRAAGARLWYLPPYSPDLAGLRQDQALEARLRNAPSTRSGGTSAAASAQSRPLMQQLLCQCWIRFNQTVKRSSRLLKNSAAFANKA